ncbi:MAG: YihY/virulence factor BrkB family protein [Anaerolineae bacterium]|nr:YihY/virulence factor BrkB family protein [Anaerolineae bacterium]
MTARDLITLVKATFIEWGEDKATRLAAALAYYAVFSVPPLILLLLVVLGRLLGTEFTENQIQSRLLTQFSGLIGAEGADVLATVIENASRPGEGFIAGIVGIVTLTFGAAGFFSQLQDAMNTIWEVAPAPDTGIVTKIKERLFSFSLVAALALLLLVSLVISAGLSALNEFITGLLPEAQLLMQIVNFAVSLAIVILLFAAIYKVIPDVHIAWRDVWVGAIVTGILFTLGKQAIGFYLGQSSTASTYGAAGSLVVFLLWIYYSAAIFFLGAEFTQVYANRFGTRLVPEEGTVPVTEEARAEQGMPARQPAAASAATAPGPAPRQRTYDPNILSEQHAAEEDGALQYYLIAILAVAVGFWRWLRG